MKYISDIHKNTKYILPNYLWKALSETQPINSREIYILGIDEENSVTKWLLITNILANHQQYFRIPLTSIKESILKWKRVIPTPIHNLDGKTLCNNCRTIITYQYTNDLYCNTCKKFFK